MFCKRENISIRTRDSEATSNLRRAERRFLLKKAMFKSAVIMGINIISFIII